MCTGRGLRRPRRGLQRRLNWPSKPVMSRLGPAGGWLTPRVFDRFPGPVLDLGWEASNLSGSGGPAGQGVSAHGGCDGPVLSFRLESKVVAGVRIPSRLVGVVEPSGTVTLGDGDRGVPAPRHGVRHGIRRLVGGSVAAGRVHRRTVMARCRIGSSFPPAGGAWWVSGGLRLGQPAASVHLFEGGLV